KKAKGFPKRDLLRQVRRLQAHADPILQPACVETRVDAEHRHVAGVSRPQPFENFNRCRFSGAVRPQQPEHFPGMDVEVHALDRFERAIAFAQSPDMDGGVHEGCKLIVHSALMTKRTRWLAPALALFAACALKSPEQKIVADAAAALGGRERVLAV